MVREQLRQRIDLLEESYEFFLAYAAQGSPGDKTSDLGGQLRGYLEGCAEALDGLAELFGELIGTEVADQERRQKQAAFVEVLAADARRSGAAIAMVLAQERISSQLIDNLNASIHLRALLTDLFLLDEILKIAASREREEGVAGAESSG